MTIASLASGPLHSTSAFLAKVATSSESETPNAQHLICVYLPDVYDKAAVTEVNAGVTFFFFVSRMLTTSTDYENFTQESWRQPQRCQIRPLHIPR